MDPEKQKRILLIDTCGDVGSVAVALGESVLAVRSIAERAASAQLLLTIGAVLAEAGCTMAEIDAVGVVNGPGSFTGVRVGLAAAKGLCEALGLRLAAVSRLDVLRVAADDEKAIVALDAGRGEVFVRAREDGVETVVALEELVGDDIVVCESRLLNKISGARLLTIDAGTALPVVLECLASGGSDPASSDARYVRGDASMYGAKPAA